MAKYGFGPSREYLLAYGDNRYDSRAILGAAHGIAHPELGPLRASEFSGGAEGAAGALEALGFAVEKITASPRVWLVRAGGRVDAERVALNEGVVGIGWEHVPSFTGVRSREEVIERLRRSGHAADYEGREGVLTKHAGEILNFVDEMSEGDFVLLPLASDSGKVAVARVTGPPHTRPEFPGYIRHVRDVDWLRANVSRDDFGPTFSTGLSYRGTVHEFDHADAAATVQSLVGHATGRSRQGDRLRAGFERVLAEYLDARQGPFSGAVEVVQELRGLADTVKALPSVRNRSTLRVKWSAGQGNWAKVPWLALLDERETTSTWKGVYVVYLFRQDMSAVYLTIAQGVTGPRQDLGAVAARELMRSRAEDFRAAQPELGRSGLRLDNAIDLRADGSLGTDYEASTVAYLRYDRGEVPPDERLLEDLEAVLSAYDTYLESAASAGGRPPLEALADDLFIPVAFLRESIELLERKRQLIYYGPPGTGKTYIARKLARYLAEDEDDRLEVVQFHPSYSYEDFVQGYRPALGADGQLTYTLKSGPLFRLAERARAAPGEKHVLLVDEINRGNLPRIFGELLFLLEYRNERVALMYGEEDEGFELPDNLYVLATMNTADRSIGLVDAALRRRFHFKALFPARPPIDEVLRRWLDREAPDMVEVATYVDRLNARLRERFGEHIQVGHSYFMEAGLDEALLGQIWQADILPFLEEQLFGHEDELKDFSLESVSSAQPTTASLALAADTEDQNPPP